MMKSDEKNNKPEIDTTGWIWRISEGESERGIHCPRCGELIPIVIVKKVDDEVRREEDASQSK